MRLSYYAHERRHLATVRDVSPQELIRSLQEFRVSPVKQGPAWSPGEVGPCPSPCRNAGKGGKECAGGELHRHERNIVAHHAVVFDCDHLKDSAAAELVNRLLASGIPGVVHSSYSHRPPENCSLRVVLLPNRPILPDEVPQVRQALQKALDIPTDPATKDLSRLYYLPTVQPEVDPFCVELVGAGDAAAAVPFDVDKALAFLASASPTNPAVPAAVPPMDPALANDLDAHRDTLRRVNSPSAKELVKKVLAGEPLAVPGEHDSSLQRLAGICATYLPVGLPFEVIAHLCETSLRKMEWQDGFEDCLRAFEEKFDRATARRQQYVAEQRAAAQQLRADLARGMAERTLDPVAAESTEDGKYTPAALDTWNVGEQEWIVQKGDIYFVFVNGDYVPRMRVELPNCVHRDLARAPVDLEVEAKTGTKELQPNDLMRRYGTVARLVEADLASKRSRYNASSGIFTEAVCPLRHLEPAYDAEIHKWLELLGGPDKEKLLDWVATVTDLSRQSCAIYLHGRSKSGKNLLAQGLAKLWTTGGPATMEEALSNFNDAVTKCPLIFADEKMPEVKGITEELRKLIGSSTRPLKRKYQGSASMNGAVRVIIAANNPDIIHTSQDMTQSDIEAVADRILYLPVPDAARDYILALGGAEYVNAWWKDDKIAKHALWLRDNRQVAPTKDRFLVMGSKRDFHERLAINSGVAKQVCEALVKALISPKPIPPAVNDFLVYGKGKLFVNVRAIELIWEMFVQTNERFPLDRLGKALATISVATVRCRTVNTLKTPIRYQEVDVNRLYTWAEENGIADREQLAAAVNREDARVGLLVGGAAGAVAGAA